MRLIAKLGPGAAVASAGAASLAVGCALAWLVFSTHLPAHYPQSSLAPIAAVFAVYIVTVALSLDRRSVPLAVAFSVAVIGALVTLVVGAVLIEMTLCHYDRYACINL